MHEPERYLKYREWLILITIVGLIASLTCISRLQSRSARQFIAQAKERSIYVELKGPGVRRPGRRMLDRGSTLGQALEGALKKNADLSNLPLNKQLQQGESIEVPVRSRKRLALN